MQLYYLITNCVAVKICLIEWVNVVRSYLPALHFHRLFNKTPPHLSYNFSVQVPPTSSVPRANRTVPEAVQAAEGEQEALPRADAGGAPAAVGPGRGIRH